MISAQIIGDSDMDLDEQVESSSESEPNDISGIMRDLEAR